MRSFSLTSSSPPMSAGKIITASLLFLAGCASPAAAAGGPGQVSINNHCGFPVYAWTSSGPTASTSGMTTIAGSGGSHSEAYQTGGLSVSIKLARQPSLQNTAVSQLEYTAAAGALWYDLSNIDGNAFADARVVLSPQAEWHASCGPVDCPVGAVCHAAYTAPSDNWATHSCPSGTGLVLDLCVAN